MSTDPRQSFLRRFHKRPKRSLHEWINAPAPIHYAASCLKNPSVEHDRSRDEFKQPIRCLGIRKSDTFTGEQYSWTRRRTRRCSNVQESLSVLVVAYEATELASYVW